MKEIKATNAPKAVGPYSQAIISGKILFCSGQIGLDPNTGALVTGGVREQAKQALQNLDAVLRAGKSSPRHVALVNVYLRNIKDFAVVNELYTQFFSSKPQPARITVGVAELPKNASIEISCIAVKK